MRVYATTDQKLVGLPTPDGWDVMLVTSDTNPNKVYRVDITFGRCDCPGWKNRKDPKLPCRHLKALGFKPVFKPGEIPEPVKTKTKEKVKVKY